MDKNVICQLGGRMSGEGMRFRYTGIRVTDLDRSVEFYTRFLGMRAVWRSKVPQTKGEMVVLRDDGDHPLELNAYSDEKKYTNGDDLDHLAFEVDDFQTVYDELRRGGVELAWDVQESPRWKRAFFKDPDGIWLEIFQMKTATRKSGK